MWGKMAVLSLILALPLSAQETNKEEEKKKDEEAKAKIAEFKKELKGAKTDADIAKGLERLGETLHPRILAELKTWLAKPSAEIAIAAAEQIGKYKKDKDASDTLVNAAGARKDKDAVVKCLRYAGDVAYKPAASKLSNYFRHRDTDIAREAVDSSAKLRTRECVDPLLGLLRELDSIREQNDPAGGVGGVGGLGGGGLVGGGTNLNNDQQKRKRDLTPAVEKALEDITGQRFKTLREWEGWWRANKGTFKDPE
jgi:hypothetical protein